MKNEVLFYSGQGNHPLGAEMIQFLGEYCGLDLKFSHVNIDKFPDKEPDLKIPNFLEIKDKTVVFYQSISDLALFYEAIDIIWALKKYYQASYLIAVIPFMIFRRQDHDEKREEILRLKMGLDLLKNVGVDEIITVDPHSSKMINLGNELGIKMHEVNTSALFASTLKPYLSSASGREAIRAYAPDEGAIPKTIALAKAIDCPLIFSLKKRGLNNEVEIKAEDRQYIDSIIANYHNQGFSEIYYANKDHINDHYIIMRDDEVTTGATASKFGWRAKNLGAKQVIFLASHAVLCDGWRRKLIDEGPFDKILLGDTIRRSYNKRTGGKVHDIHFASLMAETLYQVLQTRSF